MGTDHRPEPTVFVIFGGAGTWGPETANTLLAREGRSWAPPTFLPCLAGQPVCRVTMVPP